MDSAGIYEPTTPVLDIESCASQIQGCAEELLSGKIGPFPRFLKRIMAMNDSWQKKKHSNMELRLSFTRADSEPRYPIFEFFNPFTVINLQYASPNFCLSSTITHCFLPATISKNVPATQTMGYGRRRTKIWRLICKFTTEKGLIGPFFRYSLVLLGLCSVAAPLSDLSTWTFAIDSIPLNIYLIYLSYK